MRCFYEAASEKRALKCVIFGGAALIFPVFLAPCTFPLFTLTMAMVLNFFFSGSFSSLVCAAAAKIGYWFADEEDWWRDLNAKSEQKAKLKRRVFFSLRCREGHFGEREAWKSIENFTEKKCLKQSSIRKKRIQQQDVGEDEFQQQFQWIGMEWVKTQRRKSFSWSFLRSGSRKPLKQRLRSVKNPSDTSLWFLFENVYNQGIKLYRKLFGRW